MDPTGHLERDSIQSAVGLRCQGEANAVTNGVANARNQVVCNRLTPQGETDTNEEIQTANLVIRICLAWRVLTEYADEGTEDQGDEVEGL